MTEVKLKDDERIDQLFSQDVQIIQSKKVFSFSLDAVLLANFAEKIKGGYGTTVDLCAGNGAVGLFFSKEVKGKIIEVEIQEKLADMAKRSVKLNNLTDKMEVLNIDLKDTLDYVRRGSVEIVLCNPPYFLTNENSTKNPNEHLAIARHEITTDLDAVCHMSAQLLKNNGKLFMVHRPDRLVDILATLQKRHLAAKRIQFVHPKEGKEANMVLIEAIKDGHSGGTRILEPIVVYTKDNEYTPEVRKVLYGK